MNQRNMVGMVSVHMGEENAIHGPGIPMQGSDLVDLVQGIDQPQFQQVFQFPWNQKGVVEKMGALRETLAKIQEDPGTLIFQIDLVSANLVRTAIEDQPGHVAILAFFRLGGLFAMLEAEGRMDENQIRREIVEVARSLYERRLNCGYAGNLSVRVGDCLL